MGTRQKRPGRPAGHPGVPGRPNTGRLTGDLRSVRRWPRPLDPEEGTMMHAGAVVIRHVEDVVVKAGGAALRYGGLYGPGATDDQVELVRRRQFPLVGGGTGYTSWVHVDDAASATVLALEQQARGVFNIVDDEPALVSEWLPYLATCAGRSGRCGSPGGWPGCWPG